jgi:hypothetical protein
MSEDHELLAHTYAAFNGRDIDAVLAVMHPEVDWPNGMGGGRVHGQAAVRDTVDRNLPFQQDLPRFSIAVIVLRARSNRVADLRALIPDLLATLPVAKRGEVAWVGSEQRA